MLCHALTSINLTVPITMFATSIFSAPFAIAEGPQPASPNTIVTNSDGGSDIANILCHVIKVAQGSVGKTIATLVIISVAIGLFLGKITWGVAIAVAVGMGVLFGANTVVSFVADGTNTNICP
ncbi:TrbC/VirB2 family protein [Candidatus Bandiella euplotis]|uniref:Type IV secretion system protein VirB2 n=1 Tax=Candidatus Bandiella euplotis TaxID=1664265 RepID=A0ABZ0UMD7_9RICK|nr:Type IV secretion system protein VirB2 [Candidatus Bandiella woodruffii]